jgi:hypothetical protein
MVTALVALQEATSAGTSRQPPAHHLDLGCGIGSVLLMVAWGLPGVASCGVEAQEVSLGLARRSILYNGVADRVQVRGCGRVQVRGCNQWNACTAECDSKELQAAGTGEGLAALSLRWAHVAESHQLVLQYTTSDRMTATGWFLGSPRHRMLQAKFA